MPQLTTERSANVVVTGVAMTTALATDARTPGRNFSTGSPVSVCSAIPSSRSTTCRSDRRPSSGEFDSQLDKGRETDGCPPSEDGEGPSAAGYGRTPAPGGRHPPAGGVGRDGLGSAEELVFAYDGMRQRGLRAVSPLVVQMYMPNAARQPPSVWSAAPKPVSPRRFRHARRGRRPSPTPGATSSTAKPTWRSAAGGDQRSRPCRSAGFAQMRIVLSKNNDDPAGACRPFDRDRDGFVFGEAGR